MMPETKRFVIENGLVILAACALGLTIGHFFGLLGALIFPVPIAFLVNYAAKGYFGRLSKRNRAFWANRRRRAVG